MNETDVILEKGASKDKSRADGSDCICNGEFDFENDFYADGSVCREFTISVTESQKRIDILVAELCGITRSAAAKLIDDGFVTVCGNTVSKSFKPKCGDCVSVVVPAPRECEAQPQNIPIDIIYEDDSLLVVNKPRGMVVHPAPGNPDGTLVNALLYHCSGRLSGINGVVRPGIVHRIDKDTSGLLMVAKTDEAHVSLAKQIKEHSFKRVYIAVVYGNVKSDSGTVDLPIGRHSKDRKKMAVTDKNSKRAVTHYTVLERFRGYTLLELRLETGRTHQIRVHMSYIGHAVVGDPLYAPNGGKNAFGLVGQCLHAKALGFVHPKSGKYLEFTSEIPDYFSGILKKLRNTI